MKRSLILIAVLASALTSVAQVPNYIPTNGLVAWYPFSGNANDESGNGNNGNVNGAGLTTDRFGNLNSAYDFNGNGDFIQALYSQTPDFNSGITMQAWVRIDGTNTNYPCATQNGDFCFQFVIASSSSFDDGHYRISLNQSTLDFIGRVNSVSNGAGTTSQTVIDPNSPEWHHIVTTYDNTNVTIYVDGLMEGQNSWSGTIGQGLNTVMFGKSMNSSNYPYYTKGKIDDVGVWNRALTSCEVQQLYNAQASSVSAAVSTSGSTTFCQGGEVELTAPAGYDYLWSTTETTQSIVVNSTGTYSVQVIDGACSETSQAITTTVLTNPSVSLSPFSSVCENASAITLVGGSPAGGTYTVNSNSATELDPSVTGSGMQTIEYSYTDQNNCSGSASQNVMVNSIPNVTLSGLNTSYLLSDNPSVLSGTPSGGVFNGTGVANGMFDPAVAGLGTHGVSYAVADGNGCIGVSSLCTTVDLDVGIDGGNQISNGGGLDIYPNPANGIFNVTVKDIKGAVTYTVFDVRGREVLNGSFVSGGNHTEVVDLQTSADGVYTIQVNSANGIATQKLVKE
jgi:hypothetical protein